MAGSTALSPRGSRGCRFDRGAGANPRFPPQYADPAAARAALLDVVRRDPRQFGHECNRWTLDLVRERVDWRSTHSPAGVWRVLRHLGIHSKRAQAHIHSPDPDYVAKQATVTTCLAAARAEPSIVTLFLDEVTIARQPTLAPAYEARGRGQPRAERSQRADTATRVVATLEATTGRVCACRRSHITVPTLVEFSQTLVATYPAVERIYVVQDNWPVHTHPDLLVAHEPQENPFPWVRPANWPTAPSAEAARKWGALHLPIQLVLLPTYASWLNPIEKLWRWLRHDLGHLHRWADDLPALRAAIDTFLARFAHDSADLLRYTGLWVPG
jgi:transposase